jgi:glycosyltransferase involved in cell wall biosynthesis
MHFHSSGGMQAVAWDIARELATLGNQVTFLTTAIPGKGAEFEADGVKVVALSGTAPGKYSRAWWKLSRRFAERCFDHTEVVLSVSAAGYSLLPLKKRFPKVQMVMQAHGTSFGECLSKWRSGSAKAWVTSLRNLAWLFRDLAAYPRFDYVVAIGKAVQRSLREPPISLCLPGRKVVLIPNGIDTELFKPDPAMGASVRAAFGWDESCPIVVSASRLHRQKGVHLSLAAFAELSRGLPGARYLVLGDGPERKTLERLASELNIADKVKFAGDTDRGRLIECLQAADAFLFTTIRTEGLVLNVLEALAAGLPVVTSTLMESVIEDCPDISYHRPDDAVAAANLLEAALAQGTRTRGQRVSLLSRRYSLKSCAADYQRLLVKNAAADASYA